MTTTPALTELQRELDRTAVISQEFKRHLMSWASQAVSEAYRAGQSDAEGKPAYWRIMPLLTSGAPDCFSRRFGSRAQAEDVLRGLDTTRYEVLGFNIHGKLVEHAREIAQIADKPLAPEGAN